MLAPSNATFDKATCHAGALGSAAFSEATADLALVAADLVCNALTQLSVLSACLITDVSSPENKTDCALIFFSVNAITISAMLALPSVANDLAACFVTDAVLLPSN